MMLRKLGWEPLSGESHLSAMLREEVLMALATFGHIITQEEAMKRFQMFVNVKNTSAFPVDIRKVSYTAIMRTSTTISRTGFESLLKIYREADAVQEKTRILRCIASCPDPDVVVEVLNLLLSDEVREQDTVYVTAGISLEGREAAWVWLKEKWDLIVKRWGRGLVQLYSIISLKISSHRFPVMRKRMRWKTISGADCSLPLQ